MQDYSCKEKEIFQEITASLRRYYPNQVVRVLSQLFTAPRA